MTKRVWLRLTRSKGTIWYGKEVAFNMLSISNMTRSLSSQLWPHTAPSIENKTEEMICSVRFARVNLKASTQIYTIREGSKTIWFGFVLPFIQQDDVQLHVSLFSHEPRQESRKNIFKAGTLTATESKQKFQSLLISPTKVPISINHFGEIQHIPSTPSFR